MSQTYENRLKVFVERIVRPIIAVENDKLKMRHELYVHVSDAFEQEKSRGTNEEDAFQKATERLGDPDTVRRDLQSEVSRRSRIDFHMERFFCQSEGHSQLRHAAKLGLTLSAGITLFFFLFMSVPYLFGVTKCDGQVCTVQSLAIVWPDLLRALLRTFPFFFIASFNVAMLGIALREIVVEKPGWWIASRRLLRQATMVFLFLCLQGAALTILTCFDREPATEAFSLFTGAVFWCFFFTAIAAAAVLPWIGLHGRKYCHYAEWLELDLSE